VINSNRKTKKHIGVISNILTHELHNADINDQSYDSGGGEGSVVMRDEEELLSKSSSESSRSHFSRPQIKSKIKFLKNPTTSNKKKEEAPQPYVIPMQERAMAPYNGMSSQKMYHMLDVT